MRKLLVCILLELIALTDLDGGRIWVESTQVFVIRGKTEYCRSGVGATIRISNVAFCVRESPETIMRIIREHR